MAKVLKNYTRKFTSKYRAFNILQNKVEDVVQKTTLIWKSLYGLTTHKEIMHAPIEVGEDKGEKP